MAHVNFLSRNSYLPKSINAVKVIEEKRVNLVEISRNWLIAEQRRDSDIAEIVSILNDFSLAKDIAKTYCNNSTVWYNMKCLLLNT